MKERRNIIIIVSFILSIALLVAVYHLRNHKTPDTQEALSDLNAQTLDAFKDRFNRAASEQRIILLLSPT
jgi:hypothetical protein